MEFCFNALGLSHKYIKEYLFAGETCIDATAGRGRDTLFLSKIVGEHGKVLAFDIQEDAIKSTKELLLSEGVKNTEVHLTCHSKMASFAEESSVSAIMFNFGWLPGGDHTKFSHGNTSTIAISEGLRLLKQGGIMTLCLYYGKETGSEEKDTILDFVRHLDQKKYSVLLHEFINRKNDPPILIVITKDA